MPSSLEIKGFHIPMFILKGGRAMTAIEKASSRRQIWPEPYPTRTKGHKVDPDPPSDFIAKYADKTTLMQEKDADELHAEIRSVLDLIQKKKGHIQALRVGEMVGNRDLRDHMDTEVEIAQNEKQIEWLMSYRGSIALRWQQLQE